MVALREAADKHAAHKEVDRQYQRRKRAASTDVPVDNVTKFPKKRWTKEDAEARLREAESELSTERMQTLMFESVCRLLAEMTPETRLKVKRHMEKNYGPLIETRVDHQEIEKLCKSYRPTT